MNTSTATSGTAGICRACGTRIASNGVPFYCAKSSEMKVGVVPIYRFETPICDECVKERTSRRVRRYWLVSLAIAAVASIVVFVLAWSDSSGDPTVAFLWRIIPVLFIAGVPGAVVLIFAAIISIQVCSKKFVATQLAVKARKAELDAAGFTGYWLAPPKNLTIRRY
jgi:hypothetical protein